MAGSANSLPLPTDPVLAEWASALDAAGHWAFVLDASWRVVFATAALPPLERIGQHYFSTEFMTFSLKAAPLLDEWRDVFGTLGPFALSMIPGGREALRHEVDPSLLDLVDTLERVEMPHVFTVATGKMLFGGSRAGLVTTWFRIDGEAGQPVGAVQLTKPGPNMTELAMAAATADLGHLERMSLAQRPDRRPAAILIADLEASSPLARRLATAQYFSFVRRLVRAADQCIIDEGGIVGRHAGDGVVAFFLAETADSESDAARSCIAAARALRHILTDVAARSDVPAGDLSFRFGLHWGATLYIGRILTAGRSEVTALGDEVNETARIEACATGGRALASKSLVEQLSPSDAEALGLDPHRTIYTPLAELRSATEKARRDAPAIAVCDLTEPTT